MTKETEGFSIAEKRTTLGADGKSEIRNSKSEIFA